MSTKKMNQDLGVLVVNWNNKNVILQCLASIKKAGYISSVVVVDNGSADRSVESIRKDFPQVRILEQRENLGFAKGNNRGIKFLLQKNVKYLFVLNPDTQMESGTIKSLVKVVEKDKRIGIVGPKIYSKNGKLWSCGGVIDRKRYSGGLIGLNKKDKGQFDKMRNVDYIPGTAMLVKREVFERVGLFTEKYFIYYEDVELSLRAKRIGFKVIFVPHSCLTHLESSSFGKDSSFHQYYMARNHFLFVERNAPFFIKLREFIRLPKTIFEHWKRGEKFALIGIYDYFSRRFGKHDDWN